MRRRIHTFRLTMALSGDTRRRLTVADGTRSVGLHARPGFEPLVAHGFRRYTVTLAPYGFH